jgi:hypothetical protein
MPETLTPPPAPPVTPPVTPPTAPAGEGNHIPPQVSPEDDPNHQIALMIARRGEKKAPKEEEVVPETPKTRQEVQDGQEKLGSLISETLRFGKNKPKPKEEPPKTEVKEPPTPPPAPKETPEPPKTVVSKRKPEPEPIDAGSIARQAAAAATTAAVAALGPSLKPAPAPEPDPTEGLKPQDRHKYEVAKFLSDTDPHYKTAPRQILDQVKRAEAYANRWENQNPGKLFNPEDEEHNDFYDSIPEPWSELEFAKAERSMERHSLKEELKREYDTELSSIRETNARLELKSHVDQKYDMAVGQLIKGLGEDVDKTIRTGGVDKLEETDPITAQALVDAVKGIQPLIETMVQIDDPKGRIKVDMKNPLHQAWSEIVTEGENLCVGHVLDDGRTFARRADYARMNDAQRSKHWFLTTDNVITGFVDKSVKFLSKKIKEEKDRQIKIAQSLGFVPKAATNGSTQSTNSGIEEPIGPPANSGAKPSSPTAGAGAKVGDQPATPMSGKEKLLDSMAKILRG